MCLLRRRPLDPKSRRIYIAGCVCLVYGLVLTHFGDGFGHRHPTIFYGLRFLLMGVAIGLLYWSARRSAGCNSRS